MPTTLHCSPREHLKQAKAEVFTLESHAFNLLLLNKTTEIWEQLSLAFQELRKNISIFDINLEKFTQSEIQETAHSLSAQIFKIKGFIEIELLKNHPEELKATLLGYSNNLEAIEYVYAQPLANCKWTIELSWPL